VVAPFVEDGAKGVVWPGRVRRGGRLARTRGTARDPAGEGVDPGGGPTTACPVAHFAGAAVVGEAGVAKVEVAAERGGLVTFLGSVEQAELHALRIAEAGGDHGLNGVSGTLNSHRITGEFGFCKFCVVLFWSLSAVSCSLRVFQH